MTRDLKNILKLMEEKYPHTALLIFADESGRITYNPAHAYDTVPIFDFNTIKELIKHLQETK